MGKRGGGESKCRFVSEVEGVIERDTVEIGENSLPSRLSSLPSFPYHSTISWEHGHARADACHHHVCYWVIGVFVP